MMDTLVTALSVVTALIVCGSIAGWLDNNRLRNIASNRASDSICTFGRSLDFRRLDTSVIRAVYEELQSYFSFLGVRFPIRASDRFEDDLNMDWDDIEEIVVELGDRTGRSLDNADKNPFYGKINSVGDLVEFLCHQPVAATKMKMQNKPAHATPRKPSDQF